MDRAARIETALRGLLDYQNRVVKDGKPKADDVREWRRRLREARDALDQEASQ